MTTVPRARSLAAVIERARRAAAPAVVVRRVAVRSAGDRAAARGTGLGGQPFYFLRTVADGVRADNLGDLPTY